MKPYYEDDLVTLYHGDCLEVDAWLAADVLVTDPPYGIGWVSGGFGANKEAREVAKMRKREGLVSVANDQDVRARDAALDSWGNRPAMVFGSWRIPRPERVSHRLIWHKVKTYPGVRTGPWFPADEEIYVLGSGWVGAPEQNVYQTTRMQAASHGLVAETGHPTPKPVGLMERLIAKCPPGVIADPFAGSGSTLVAARNLGRHAIGVELEERYCEAIAKRLSQQAFNFEDIA